MIPEPELKGLDEFRAYMLQRGLIVRRVYEWPSEEDEIGYWQIYLAKEETRFDDKLYVAMLTVDDRDIIRGWKAQWDTLVELVEAGFKHTLEENRVSDEDERIHKIRELLETPNWQLQGLDGHFHFLLDVVDRLKGLELLMQDELKWNWRKAGEDRYALERISEFQQKARAIIEENGFVFDDIGMQPGNWKHLAFTLYTEICEIDTIARQALSVEIESDSARRTASS